MSVGLGTSVEVHAGWHDGAGAAPWKDTYMPQEGTLVRFFT